MNLFSKGNSSLAEAVSIELLNEPDWYTSGARVRGQVVISSRVWTQMSVEVLIICEEHAELNPAECDAEGYEFRRMTIAGETVDGEAAADDVGAFPFELRILDDPDAPFLLPSFDVDNNRGLLNAIKWTVEVRVEHKGRISQKSREIAFMPSRPRPVAQQPHQILTQDMPMRAYEQRSSPSGHKFAPKALRITPVQQFHDAVVVGQLQLPGHAVEQAPAELPLRLSVASSHPHLLAVTRIEVQLVQLAEARIEGTRCRYTVMEKLFEQKNSFIPLNDSIVDLTSYLGSVHIENACSNFAGRWLSMKHYLQVVLRLCAVNKTDYVQTLKVSGPLVVLPPCSSSEHVDAPPRYTPPEMSPVQMASPQSSLNWPQTPLHDLRGPADQPGTAAMTGN